MTRFLATSIASLGLALGSSPVLNAAENAQPPATAPSQFQKIVGELDLKDGDSVVFLGDSITHQCLYTQYVENYFYTRYPATRIHFHNSGVGGDRAADALTRFDEDVTPYKPKYVTILLGMNDGSYTDFKQDIFDRYQKDMTTILDRIAAIGAVAVPMTPTMHDARAARTSSRGPQEPRDTYYNSVLAFYGTWLREMAQQRGLGFVDMWSPLNNLTITKRKTDANWTMIQDAVHPGPVGQTVMATALINDMVKKTVVSQIAIDGAGGKTISKPVNATVSDIAVSPGVVTFTALENALPWVLPEDAAEGAALTALGHRHSNQKLTVRQLPVGNYTLKIDGQPVGEFTEGQLAGGVELENNAKTPQYQQALKVALLNRQRNDEAYRPLRDQYGQLKGKRRELKKATDENDPQLAEKKTAFAQWYASQKAKVAELRAKAQAIEDQIYAANQPKPHTFEVALVK